MNIHFNAWIKLIFSLLILSMSGISQAAPVIAEQILPGNGGNSVAISGEWGFVGAGHGNGQTFCQVKVYKYDYTTNLWGDGGLGVGNTVVSGTILPDEPYTQLRNTGSCNTAEFGGFGRSVSASNGLLAVGAPLAKDGGSTRGGKIFFYQYDPAQIANGTGGWVQDTAVGFPVNPSGSSDLQQDAGFGAVVSIRYTALTDTAVMLSGAPLYDVDQGLPSEKLDAGKAYLYLWSGITNTVIFINSVEGENAGDFFGSAVTSNGTNFLAGAPGYDDGASTDNGAAYLYQVTTTPGDLIVQDQKITDSSMGLTPVVNHNLGISVSLSPGADSVMLLGGNGTPITGGTIQLKSLAGVYNFAHALHNTQGGDVSQDGNTAGFGYKDRSVQLYYDKQDLTGLEDWKYSRAEADYGRDISVSGSRVMVNGNTNNRAYAYYTPCGASGQLVANEWTMIGLQCQTSATIDEIFGDDLGAYDTNWIMYQQNGFDYEGHQNAYVAMASTDVMVQGLGYWIIADADQTWQIDDPIVATGTPTVADPLAGTAGREDVAAVHKTLLSGTGGMLDGLTLPTVGDANEDIRVMFSNPYPSTLDWSTTLLEGSGGAFNLSILSGFFEGGDISAYVYDPATGGYTAIVYTTPGLPREIGAGEGFYIRFSDEFHTDVLNANVPLDLILSQSK